jgi:hypothetical protein
MARHWARLSSCSSVTWVPWRSKMWTMPARAGRGRSAVSENGRRDMLDGTGAGVDSIDIDGGSDSSSSPLEPAEHMNVDDAFHLKTTFPRPWYLSGTMNRGLRPAKDAQRGESAVVSQAERGSGRGNSARSVVRAGGFRGASTNLSLRRPSCISFSVSSGAQVLRGIVAIGLNASVRSGAGWCRRWTKV